MSVGHRGTPAAVYQIPQVRPRPLPGSRVFLPPPPLGPVAEARPDRIGWGEWEGGQTHPLFPFSFCLPYYGERGCVLRAMLEEERETARCRRGRMAGKL